MVSVSMQIKKSFEANQKLAWSIINSTKRNTLYNSKIGRKKQHEASCVCNEFAQYFETISALPEIQIESQDVMRKLVFGDIKRFYRACLKRKPVV